MYSFVVYLYVNGSGSITSVGEERANLSAVVYLYLCGFCLERFPLPLGAWDGLRYFIVALPEPSINNFATELRPLIDVRILFLLNILRTNRQIETKFCIHIIIDKINICIVNLCFSQICNRVTFLD